MGKPRLAGLGFATLLSLLPVLTSVVFVERAIAQSVSGGETLRSILSQPEDPTVRVQDRLDALIESTKRAREEREQESFDESPPRAKASAGMSTQVDGAPGARSLATGSDIADNVNLDSVRSMSEIRERLRILQRLRRNTELSARAAEVFGGEMSAHASKNTETSQPAPGLREQGSNTQQQPTLSAIEENLDHAPPDERMDPVSEASNSVAAERILPKPVNSIALGESLYRTGNYQSALKALLTVDTSRLTPSDRTWLDLLVSLCQWKMGDFETAAGTLREIANEKSKDYPVQAAKWWLKHVEASQGTRVKLNDLNAGLDSLLERSRTHVGS